MSRKFSVVTAVAIIVVSVALAAFLISRAPEPVRIELPPQIPFVQTGLIRAGSGPIPVFASGTVRPSAEVDIVPQVGGRIVWVDPGFQSGGRVAAGQMIFRMDEVDFQYRIEEAEANLAASRVALLNEQEQALIARQQYELYSDLRGDEGSPSMTNPLTLREPQLNLAQAAFDRDEAMLADANLALSRTTVTAPFDGFVQEESVDVGQIVAAGQPVGRIFATDAVEVIVPLSDSDAALIPELWSLSAGDGNQAVAVRVVARYGDGTYAWDGYVDRAKASLDRQTRTIDVIVRVPDPLHSGVPMDGTVPLDGAPPLLVGKFVEVEIDGLELEPYYRAPRAALQSGNKVWIVEDGGLVSIVPVRVLQRRSDEVYVTGALQTGQAVITGGIQFATEGMRVLTEVGQTP